MIHIDLKKCNCCLDCVNACPFDALENDGARITVNESCRACGVCVKACPHGAITIPRQKKGDLSQWKGILVYGEFVSGKLHPVTLELLGKACELSQKCGQPVYCVLIGHHCSKAGEQLLQYSVQTVLVYDHPEFNIFRNDLYANALEDAISYLQPGAVLVGATPIGRSLAPKVAVRFRTGLTADCTSLEMTDKGELIQVRPAFGGNIMARIVTPYTRPQFATVRYKVMEIAMEGTVNGEIQYRSLPADRMMSGVTIRHVATKEKAMDIVDCDRIVVAGKGIKSQADMALINNFALAAGAEVAGTRPMIEKGWVPTNRQIGLSGRTVKPKLIVTCGVSGAVQFVAGMKASDCIVSINTDKDAPIFQVADYAVVGDLYHVLPRLAESMDSWERRDALSYEKI